MTPTARPDGWILLRADNTAMPGKFYVSLTWACTAADRLAVRGVRVRPEPVWSRTALAEVPE